jgi:rhodanese-related sulfurtransferase
MKQFLLALFFTVSLFVSCLEPASNIQVVSPQEVYDAVFNKSNASLQLVDVRTAEEYGVSHLKDAQNICVTEDDFKEKVKDLDREKPVYVYCRSGGRSARAAEILAEMGFTEIYDLDGGITAWKENGLETID